MDITRKKNSIQLYIKCILIYFQEKEPPMKMKFFHVAYRSKEVPSTFCESGIEKLLKDFNF